MAIRGQRPKPVALRLLNGNAGKRPINAQEPRIRTCTTEPPEWLTDVARAHWSRLAPLLSDAGVLKESDRDLLATYCTTFTEYVEAIRAGEKVSMTTVGQLRQLMGELGMTPSARARIVADREPEDGAETKARFFAA
jgi:phage terminase small subunit